MSAIQSSYRAALIEHLIRQREKGEHIVSEPSPIVSILSTGFDFSTKLLPVGCGANPETVRWFRAALGQVVTQGLTQEENSDDNQVDLARENVELRSIVVDLLMKLRASTNARD